MNKVINIAKDFSPFPAGRHRTDGPFTGEAFREDILAPALREGSVNLVLDGVMGLPSSFYEEALGGLVRIGFPPARLRQILTLEATSTRMQAYPARGWELIDKAADILASGGASKISA